MLLGMPISTPGLQKYTEKDGVVFYPVKDNLGYHVPLDFDRFIQTHGGLAFSGNPISEVAQVQPHIYRQCFVNYCLDYDSSAPANAHVKIAALGSQYLQKSTPQAAVAAPAAVDSSKIHLQVSEAKPQLDSSEEQQINIVVLQPKNMKPMQNVDATLKVLLTNGEAYTAAIPPTNAQGIASVTVPAMPELKTGTIVTYQVCLNLPTEQQVCTWDGYLIWNIH
jgi:hypothetical protein